MTLSQWVIVAEGILLAVGAIYLIYVLLRRPRDGE